MAKGSRFFAALLMALLAAGCSGGGVQTTPPTPTGPTAPVAPSAAPTPPASTPVAEVDLPSQPLAVFAHEVMGLRYRRQSLDGKVAVGVVLPPSLTRPALLQYGLVSAEKYVKQGKGEVVVDLWWQGTGDDLRVSREHWTLGPSHGQWRVEGVASSDTCDLRVVGDALTLRKDEHPEKAVRLADLPHMASPNGSNAQFGVAREAFAAAWPAADCTAAAFVTRGAGQPLVAWVTKLDEHWTVTPLDLYFEGGGLAVRVSPDGRYAGVLAALPSGAYTIALYNRDRARLQLNGLPKTANAPGMMKPPTELHWEGEVLIFTFGGQIYQVVPGNPATVQAVH